MTGASVFRRTRHGRRSKRWTILLTLPDGRRREVAGFADKQATLQRAARLVRDLERHEVGLHDLYATARKTPLGGHVDDFLAALESGSLARRRSGRPTAEHVRRTRRRLTSMFAKLGATRLEQLAQDRADHLLAEGVRGGWSDKTRDDHAALLRQFGGWLVDAGRWPANPFHRLRPTRTQASRTFRRKALTVDELVRLVEAAEVRPARQIRGNAERRRAAAAVGRERGLLYLVAAFTGLRRGEVLALTWADLRLQGQEPAVLVRPETAKNRKASRIDLPVWLAARLQAHQLACATASGRVDPGARVFRAGYVHLTERLRGDALWAELGTEVTVRVGGKVRTRVQDGAGRTIDFHALRGTYATLLAEAGVPASVARDLMRHADSRLTFEVYAQVRSSLGRTAVDRLPAPFEERPEPEQEKEAT